MHRDDAPLGAPTWVELFTSDTERAEAFYGEVFGWTAQHTGPEYGGYINFAKGDELVAGCMRNDGAEGKPDLWTVYLAVKDAQATADDIVAHGGSVMIPPMAVGELGTMALFVDAAGAGIGAWQPGLHRGFGVLNEPGAPGWCELHSRDYDTSLAFYRDAFGWEPTVVADEPGFRYATYGEGDGALAGIMDAAAFLPDGMPSTWSVYFATDDADATVRTVVAAGGAVVHAPEDTPYGRLATVTDPTGTAFKLIQR